MSFESEFDEFLNDVVYRAPFTGRNDYGEPTYGGAVPIMARVVFKPSVIVSGASETTNAVREVVSRAAIYVGPDPVWLVTDQVTLPDGTTPEILAVESYPDETSDPSLHHQKVLV